MTGAEIGFWITAVVSVVTALGVVLHRNPIRSALFLVVNFVTLAVLYLLLNAQLLAVLQILVYAGAIMVLFLFVVQMLNLGGELATNDPLVGQRLVGLLLGVLMVGGLIYAINVGQWAPPGPDGARMAQAQAAQVTQIQLIGWDLFTRYIYPFELTSVLLLVGVIGTVLLSRSRRGEADKPTLRGER